jgi:hypothetical protein
MRTVEKVRVINSRIVRSKEPSEIPQAELSWTRYGITRAPASLPRPELRRHASLPQDKTKQKFDGGDNSREINYARLQRRQHGSRGHFILSGDSGSIIATRTTPPSLELLSLSQTLSSAIAVLSPPPSCSTITLPENKRRRTSSSL